MTPINPLGVFRHMYLPALCPKDQCPGTVGPFQSLQPCSKSYPQPSVLPLPKPDALRLVFYSSIRQEITYILVSR